MSVTNDQLFQYITRATHAFRHLSAMHRSLRIPEILAYIFEYALRTSDDGRAVLNLALTCQTFKDPALATLWRSMDSLVPLVKCLPRDCWEERARDGGEILYIKRLPTVLELGPMQMYARLIRHLELSGHHQALTQLDSGVLTAISSIRTDPILPNLLTLRLKENARQALDNVYLLIGEKLTALSLDFSEIACDEITGCRLLDTLRTTSPFVEKLEISRGPGISLSLSSALSELVCGSKHVRTFSSPCISLNAKAIAHLSYLPHLQVLGVRIPDASSLSLLSSPFPPNLNANPNPFPDLREVTVWTEYLSTATEMLRRMQPSLLEVLVFHIEDTPCTCDVDTLFSTMIQHCCTTLKRVYGFQDHFTDESRVTRHEADFRPLLLFPNLEYVWLNACISFAHMDNALIRDMACAWPHLRELDLGGTSCWGATSHVTLEGLLQLCEHCPELSSLGLTMDASGSPPALPPSSLPQSRSGSPARATSSSHRAPSPIRQTKTTPPNPPENARMEALQVGNSHIGVGQVAAVARYLRRIYPNLSELRCWPDDGNTSVGWLVARVAWLMVGDIATGEEGRDPTAPYLTQ